MKSRAVTENLTQLTRWRFVNAFLVREEDGFTLVDTTLSGGARALIAAADEAGGAIRRIALTHGHGDHVGSLDALKQRLGESVEVLMPEVDARILAGEKVVDGKLPGSWPKVRGNCRRGFEQHQPASGEDRPGCHGRECRIATHRRGNP